MTTKIRLSHLAEGLDAGMQIGLQLELSLRPIGHSIHFGGIILSANKILKHVLLRAMKGLDAGLSTMALSVGMVACIATLSGCAGFFINTDTTTTLISSATSVAYDSSVTLVAKISTTAATGTVLFYDGTTELGSETASSGTATLVTSALAVGAHTIYAEYEGDATYEGSTSSTITVIVSESLTTTTAALSVSSAQAAYGTSITLTAALSSTSATGTVTFYSGATVVGKSTVALGVATLTTTALPVGSDSIVAIYGGDSAYSTSTSGAIVVAIT